MPGAVPDGGRVDRRRAFGSGFDPEELRRRNPNALAMDVLYLFTTAFFVLLVIRGVAPAVIAAAPLGALLYFGWKSSRPFFVAQVLAMAATAAASAAGLVPL